MENTEGQGQHQEPEENCSHIESTSVPKCPNSEICIINDEIPVVVVDVISVVSFANTNASAHPTTCQTNQLTIGQHQTPKKT